MHNRGVPTKYINIYNHIFLFNAEMHNRGVHAKYFHIYEIIFFTCGGANRSMDCSRYHPQHLSSGCVLLGQLS